jgi:glycosyltransferase involved in cell wall biosynthesis
MSSSPLRRLARRLGPLRLALRRVILRITLLGTRGDSRPGRFLTALGWRSSAAAADLVLTADADRLARFIAAAPDGDRNRATVALLQRLHGVLVGDDPAFGQAPAESGGADPAVRAAVAQRLIAAGQPDAAWGVVAAAPPVTLADPHLQAMSRGMRDRAGLAALADRTTQRLEAGESRQSLVRLHREVLLNLGKLAFADHDLDEALAWFLRAHREVGPTVHTWTLTARTLARLGRSEESRSYAQGALDERPDWAPALIHLAALARQVGDRAASVDHLRAAVAVEDISTTDLHRTIAAALRVGEPGLALEATDRLLAAGGDQPLAHATRAVALWRLRRRDEAERIVAPFAERDDAAAVEAHAYFLGRTGRSVAARDRLLADLDGPPEGPVAAELTRMLRRDGHVDLAGETAHAALALDPRDPQLRTLAAEIDANLRVFTGAWSAPPRSVTPGEPVPGRVLHVVGQSVPYASSGYCVRTDHTVRAQRALGIDAHVVTKQGFPWDIGRDAPDEEEVHGVPHHRLAFPSGMDRTALLDVRLERNVQALTDLVERLRPQVLHAASDFRNALIGLEVAERFDLPLVYELRGFWEDTWLAKRDGIGADSATYQLRRERETDAARRASHVVTLAPPMRDELIERGVEANTITLVPNAVDPVAFGELPRADALADRLGIAGGEVVVGYISSFAPYEGIDVLIEAIARARAGGSPVRGLLVGDGEVMPDLRRQVADAGLEDVVQFTGRVPHGEIRDYYSLLDVFVVPRTNARVCRVVSPLKPYEAMASSRAMIVSGTPVLNSIIEEGVTGLSFEPEDPVDLAARITELAAAPDRRRELGDAARARVLAENTWERNAERYLEVYRSLGVTVAAPVAGTSPSDHG